MNFIYREDTVALSVLIDCWNLSLRNVFCQFQNPSMTLYPSCPEQSSPHCMKSGIFGSKHNSNANCRGSSHWQLSFRLLARCQHFEMKPAYLYHQSSGWCTPFVVAVVVGCYLAYLFTGGHVHSAFNCNIQNNQKSSLLWCKIWNPLSVLWFHVDNNRDFH